MSLSFVFLKYTIIIYSYYKLSSETVLSYPNVSNFVLF